MATARCLVTSFGRSVAPVAARGVRASSRALTTSFKDKESAEENIYFAREDKVLLEKLLAKLKLKEEGHIGELKDLIKPHELPDDVLSKIVDWKMHH
mmetsp:Transcript_3540/g.10939  ORF Transcript_3540/g.10939 Transcript_3540/m.10939 type:complete len:97 (+) Transcript_3540:43-333(+)|eukprot:CAMPEP_0197393606 /NCGR_PEP_ID=MMETSP1165-20131217/4417_1 /TAXON_ID=284809 /ORGANISM="Chrysocystis fragilis, Strain CCMP3189" /LENGTH=96 /DNA_ID=CAMNT_0042919279 /DNA_START=42 /DNA_END=332 /DNA_ORIENTATION=-